MLKVSRFELAPTAQSAAQNQLNSSVFGSRQANRSLLSSHGFSGPRDGWVGFIILIAVACATALAALSVLVRDTGEPVVLSVLALLAVIGVFAIFSFAVGLVRFTSDTQNELVALFDSAADGLIVTDADGTARYANEAFFAIFPDAEIGSQADIEALLLANTSDHGAVSQFMRAGEFGQDAELELTLASPDGANASQDAGHSYRISVSHIAERMGDGTPANMLTEWRLRELDGGDPEESHEVMAPEVRQACLAQLAGWHGHALLLDWVAGRAWPGGSAIGTAKSAGPKTTEPLSLDKVFSTLSRGERAALHGSGDAGEKRLATVQALSAAHTSHLLRLLGEGAEGASAASMSTAPDAVRQALYIPRPDLGDAGLIVIPSPAALVQPRSPAPALTGPSEQQSEVNLATIEAAPIAVATVNARGAITTHNAAFGEMFSLSGEEAGNKRSLLGLLDGEGRSVTKAMIQAVSKGKAHAPVEIAFGEDGKNTGRLYANRLSGPLTGDDAVIVYAVDLTKERELEVRFAQSQKMQAVGQLAGGMAHDFNNVLTTIILSSDFLLGNHRPSDPAFKDIMAIKQNASRAAGIVKQLLAFSRQQTLRPRVLSLTDVISDWSIWLSRILEEKIELKVSHGRDLWYVKADQTQFEQVIMNLAVNARDAMSDGGRLTIRTYNLESKASRALEDKSLPPGDYVVCEVADTGCGMATEVVEKIFEPFFSTKEIGKGTGLGLSTVYGIVKQTGGYIFCDSTPAKGTTFTIYLPRYIEAEAEATAQKPAQRRDRAKDLTGTGTVLLVEDEEAVRRFAARALTRQGYNVLEAGSGTEALERLADANGEIDLVVSDIMMPEMDGPSLLKKLRGEHPDLKFIFISGYAEDALKNLDEGVEFSFLPKPFQLKELVTTVKETLQK